MLLNPLVVVLVECGEWKIEFGRNSPGVEVVRIRERRKEEKEKKERKEM